MTARWVTVAGWFVLLATVVALELRARVWPSRYATLGETVSAVLRIPLLRWLALAGWLWLGWHLFVR